ncbi:MAG: FkbM family methyltransferase [Candidatus Nitrosocosmicus sp.]
MSKLNKIFSKNFRVHLATSLQFRSSNYLRKVAQKEESLKEKKWIDNFAGQDDFVFQLDEQIKVYLYKDSMLSRYIYDGFEKDEIEFLKSNLKPGDIFVDIGSNVGLFSLVASKIVGTKGLVYSFEPTPQTFTRLEKNIALNGLFNIKAKNIGLSDEKGKLDLQISENGFEAWNTFAQKENKRFQYKTSVEVSTLDDELTGIDKSRISFIKIDVEGWEKFVLKGGKSFFQNYSPIVMVEFTETNTFDAGYFVQEIYDIMVGFGYNWFRNKNGQLIPEEKKLRYPYDNLIAKKLSAWDA